MAKPDEMPRHDDPTELEPRPRPASDRGPGATPSQLREDIDAGATGDRIPVLDPAAAPLGADAEASGVAPSPANVARAREMERNGAPAPPPVADKRHGTRGLWFGVILVALVVIAILVAWFGQG